MGHIIFLQHSAVLEGCLGENAAWTRCPLRLFLANSCPSFWCHAQRRISSFAVSFITKKLCGHRAVGVLENCLEAQCAWRVGHEERLAFKGRDTSRITRGRSCRVVRRGRELAGRCLRKMTSVDDYHQRREGMVAGELACSDGTCWVITNASQRRHLQNSKVSRVHLQIYWVSTC